MIDIIITTIGRRTLAQALLAAVQQTHPDVRVVVIKDGPQDGAQRIVDALAASGLLVGANVLTVQTPEPFGRGNLAKSWWIEDKRCSEWVRFLDDDDWMPPSAIEEMAKAIDGDDVTLVTCLMCTLIRLRNSPMRWRMNPAQMQPDKIGGGSALIRTDAARVANGLQAVPTGDYEFLKRVADQGRRVHVNAPLYYYNGWRTDRDRYGAHVPQYEADYAECEVADAEA